jgi:hypothetical protein
MAYIYNLMTFDYEIFGNGSGDLKYCLIEPTRTILQLLENHGVRATFFVDICLWWAIQANEAVKNFHGLPYSSQKLFESQILDIIERKHDVQLHAHPQMIDTIYKDGQFQVGSDNWRIADLPYHTTNNRFSISYIIREGKKSLEDLIKAKFPDYRVIAFRAGGLCSRPEEPLIRSLKENNFRFDFSAAYMFKIDSGLGKVDFTDVFPNPDPVPVGRTYLDHDDNSNLIAMPVYGAKYYYISEIFKRIKKRISDRKPKEVWVKKKPVNCSGSGHTPGYFQPKETYFTKKFKTVVHNYFLETGFEGMRWCTENAFSRMRKLNKNLYMVGIGHPKAMGDLSQLELYLKWVEKHGSGTAMQYKTVHDIENHNFNSI